MTIDPAPDQAVPDPDAVALRAPVNRVCDRAVGYWRTEAALGLLLEVIVGAVVYFLVPSWPWWATALVALALAASLFQTLVVPRVRYRIHGWEVSQHAIHTRSGWLSIDTRIAPLNRVQTVTSKQGPLMRLFRLASLTITTASAAGPITIEGLDADEARRLVAQLTAITAASEGDAT